MGVLAGVVVAAIGAELTFSGPGVSVLDVTNTLVGGALALVALGDERPSGGRVPLVAVGVGLVLAGLAVRYQVQPVTKHWWWEPV